MKVAIRTVVSLRQGAGHLTRCIALLQGLEDVLSRAPRVYLLLDPSYKEREAFVRSAKSQLRDCCVLDAKSTSLDELSPLDWMIVDHYDLGFEFESAARSTGARILAIDDLVRTHDADVLVDQTLNRREDDYAGKVPGHCCVLTGSKYALLRRSFRLARATQDLRKRIWHMPRRILVSLGLSERTGLAARVARVAASLVNDVSVRVLTSAADPHLGDLHALAKSCPNRIEVLTDVDDICGLLAAADIGVGAAGVTTWERFCMGLPSIVVQTADNQTDIISAAARTGAIHPLDWQSSVVSFEAELRHALNSLVCDEAILSAMAARAADLVDGEGPREVAARMVAISDRLQPVAVFGKGSPA